MTLVRGLPVLREVFGGVASFATEPAGMAAALLAEVGEERRSAGRALARGHSWDAAAAAHLKLYGALAAGGAARAGGTGVDNWSTDPRFVTQ
jgi:hypothetical protein